MNSPTRCFRPPVPATAMASAMLSAALRYGTRFRAVCCQTNPTVCRWYCTRCRLRHRRQIPAGHDGPPGGGAVEPGENRQQCRLSRPRSPDEGDDLARVHPQVEPLQRLHLDALHGENTHEILAQDVGRRGLHVCHSSPLRAPASRMRRDVKTE